MVEVFIIARKLVYKMLDKNSAAKHMSNNVFIYRSFIAFIILYWGNIFSNGKLFSTAKYM
jgi:hypothetical protein